MNSFGTMLKFWIIFITEVRFLMLFIKCENGLNEFTNTEDLDYA